MAIRNLRVTRSIDRPVASSVKLKIAGAGSNPLLASDCVGDVLPVITVGFAADATEWIVAIPVKAGTDPTKRFTATLIEPDPSATLPGAVGETIGYTVAETGQSATVAVAPIAADTFDGDGSLASRANWAVPSGDSARWTTASGQLVYSGGGTSIVTFGSPVGDHIARIDYDCTSANWNSEYQFFRLWSQDANNYLRMRIDTGGTPRKVTQVSFEATVGGVLQSKKPSFFPNYPAVPQSKGTIEVVLAKNALRVRFDRHWCTSNYGDYNYPFDRVSLSGEMGMPVASQTGPLGFVGATGSYPRADFISVEPVAMTIDTCDDFVAQIAIGSPNCRASVAGTYTGTPVSWQYRVWNATMTAAGAWVVVTPTTTAANGLYSLDVILQHNTDNYVEAAWVGADGLYRSARSTMMQAGDAIMYFGQSNSRGRSEYYDVPKGATYANFVKDTEQDGSYPPGRAASLFVDLPASSSMTAARTVSEKTGIRTAVMVAGVNATGISYLSPPGGGWGVFTRDRAKIKGIIKAFIWDQGENDADGASATSDYADIFINRLMPAFVSASGYPDVKIFINLIGNYPTTGLSSGDAAANDVRRAFIRDQQQDIINRAGGRVVWGSSKLGLNHGSDAYHYTGGAYAEGCARDGLSVARSMLGTGFDGRGPILTGIARIGRVLTLTANLNGSTTITGPTFKQTFNGTRIAPTVANSLLGYQVALASGGNFTTLLPIETITPTATGLVITLVSDPGAAVKVRSMAGSTYDDTNLFYGDNGLPVWPVITPLTA